MTEDETKVLIVQLEQLNERSRWYGARRWQMPFAYLAVVGLVISRIPFLCGPTTGSVYVLLGALGVAVCVSMWLIKEREKNAVDKLKFVERWLNIPDTARAESIENMEGKKKVHASTPLFCIVVAAGVFLLTIGIAHVAGAFFPRLPLCNPKVTQITVCHLLW